jgi:hypothetical protein
MSAVLACITDPVMGLGHFPDEHDAFDEADRAATETALSALAALRAIPQNRCNERVVALLVNELRSMVEQTVNWKHREHATDVGERLTDCVYVLENVSDAAIREAL